MKQRMLTLLLCLLFLFSITGISASAEGEVTDKPLSIAFLNATVSGNTVAFDVTLQNSKATAVNVSTIDLHLDLTGAYVGFSAGSGTDMLVEAGSGAVRLYRTRLDATLAVPADGALVLGTLTVSADSGTVAVSTASANNAVTSPGYQYSLLNEVKTVTHTIGGVTVSGLVKGYNSSYAPVAKLYDATTDTAHDSALYIAAVSSAAAAGEQFKWVVLFANVAPGTYDLVITKAAHLTYTVTRVVVGNTALELAANTTKAYSTMSMLAGDVNGDGAGDGMINNLDYAEIMRPDNFNKSSSVASNVGNVIADINGDGMINNIDYAIVLNPAHFNTNATDCTFAY